jgi:hypothetical protein
MEGLNEGVPLVFIVVLFGPTTPYPAAITVIVAHRVHIGGQCYLVPDRYVPDQKILDVAPLGQSVPWILCPWPNHPIPKYFEQSEVWECPPAENWGRDEIVGVWSGAYTATLYMMVTVMKGGVCAPPTPPYLG